MAAAPHLLLQLAVILVLARVLARVLGWLRQPPVKFSTCVKPKAIKA